VRRRSLTFGAKVEAAHMRGLLSRVERTMTGENPTPTPESITQSTTIEDADRILRMQPVVVKATASLAEVAEQAVANTGCRLIAVVDDDQHLVGVIPVSELVNEIFQKIVPEEFLGEITDLDAVLEYAGRIGARTAGDLMREPVSVHADENVRTAFERMHVSGNHGLPITDRAERVLGYVDQLELLVVWVRASGSKGLLEPTDESAGTRT
jgi:CBS domain-containing protein